MILSQCVYIYIKHQVVHLKYDFYMSKISIKLFMRESRWKQIGDREKRQLSEVILLQIGSKQKVAEVGSREGFIKWKK